MYSLTSGCLPRFCLGPLCYFSWRQMAPGQVHRGRRRRFTLVRFFTCTNVLEAGH